ncbi:MAG: Hsp20/alpha crystallin family protein [Deltaproteobacteria bacterium]|nr:Hsp20/alpha crystallin family protein [Deltaproteobacteria bacterium]
MSAEKKKAEAKKEGEGVIDFGIGKISLGGVFKGLGELVDMAQKVAEKGEVIRREGGIKGLGKEVKGVYGFSIRTLGGKPIIEPFGNIKESPEGPVVEEVREPMVDIFDEKDHILIIAEMPGVEKDDINIDVKDEVVTLKAERGQRKYKKDVPLPSSVNAATFTSAYKNGIMEIKIEKRR